MLSSLRFFFREEWGGDLEEYALLLALIAIFVVLALHSFGKQTATSVNRAQQTLSSAASGAAQGGAAGAGGGSGGSGQASGDGGQGGSGSASGGEGDGGAGGQGGAGSQQPPNTGLGSSSNSN